MAGHRFCGKYEKIPIYGSVPDETSSGSSTKNIYRLHGSCGGRTAVYVVYMNMKADHLRVAGVCVPSMGDMRCFLGCGKEYRINCIRGNQTPETLTNLHEMFSGLRRTNKQCARTERPKHYTWLSFVRITQFTSWRCCIPCSSTTTAAAAASSTSSLLNPWLSVHFLMLVTFFFSNVFRPYFFSQRQR